MTIAKRTPEAARLMNSPTYSVAPLMNISMTTNMVCTIHSLVHAQHNLKTQKQCDDKTKSEVPFVF